MRARTGGIALLEMLVAMALSLLLLGSVATLLVQQAVNQRRLLAQVRMAQDLHTVADVVARELRRARHWAGAAGTTGVAPGVNPHSAVWPAAEDVQATAVGFSYSDDASDGAAVMPTERFGFRLHPHRPVLEMRLSAAQTRPDDSDNWQPLTDPQSVRITGFTVVPHTLRTSLLDQCARASCRPGEPGCAPTLEQTAFDIEIVAADPHDPNLTQKVNLAVRVRNDVVTGACPP